MSEIDIRRNWIGTGEGLVSTWPVFGLAAIVMITLLNVPAISVLEFGGPAPKSMRKTR
jgi:hypothetical protein